MAIQLYVQDNNEKFFPDPNPPTTPWSKYLSAYNEGSIYNCPSTAIDGTNNAPEYGFNANLFGKAMGKIAAPTSAILAVDLKKKFYKDNYAITSLTLEDAVDARHNRGYVAVCADGHVQTATVNPGEAISASLWRNGLTLAATVSSNAKKIAFIAQGTPGGSGTVPIVVDPAGGYTAGTFANLTHRAWVNTLSPGYFFAPTPIHNWVCVDNIAIPASSMDGFGYNTNDGQTALTMQVTGFKPATAINKLRIYTSTGQWSRWDNSIGGHTGPTWEAGNPTKSYPVFITVKYKAKTGVGNWISLPPIPTGWTSVGNNTTLAKWYDYAIPIPGPVEDIQVAINENVPDPSNWQQYVQGATFELGEIEFWGVKSE